MDVVFQMDVVLTNTDVDREVLERIRGSIIFNGDLALRESRMPNKVLVYTRRPGDVVTALTDDGFEFDTVIITAHYDYD